MASQNVKTFTDGNFAKEVINSSTPTLVDFWATWCAPCRAIAPHVEAMADQYQGRLQVGKVDIDSNQKIANDYQIRSIPTLLLFQGGKVVGQIVGAVSKSKIEELVGKHLPKASA